jgi:hypothetical protein
VEKKWRNQTMSEEQYISEGMRQELDRRIQAANGNVATVRQEVENELQGLGSQPTTGEVALLRGQLLYLDSLEERQQSAKPTFGRQRHSGPRDQSPASFGDKWRASQPTKAHLVWAALAAVVLTVFIGFTWGGWTTASGAQKMADAAAKTAVTERLAPICVAQFNLDPDKNQKLEELNTLTAYQRAEYVRDQGWATIFGETEPNRKVADECVKLLTQISE